MKELERRIFNLTASNFEDLALLVFQFQYQNNTVYRNYCELLGKSTADVKQLDQIPFLPISAFKNHAVCTGQFDPEIVFTSSGTSGEQTSKHFLKSLELYERSFFKAFQLQYGEPSDYCILALLPAYLERKGSSLIYMVEQLMNHSAHPKNGFYLYNQSDLHAQLNHLQKAKQKTLLLGVSFALLDFAEQYQIPEFPELTIMETGGMKGRRKELTRAELHERIKLPLAQDEIHSEYGMTELLSQAYAQKQGLFVCPPWMQVRIRQQDDPFSYAKAGEIGGLNLIDLANLYSCSFLQADDLGRINSAGEFEVLGRFDQSEVRGCNLLIA